MTWALIIYLSMSGTRVAEVKISNFDTEQDCLLVASNTDTTPSEALDWHIDNIRYVCVVQGEMK